MTQQISPLAGKPAPASILVDVPKLLAAYVDLKPDPSVPAQRVAFGTSGHRGSSFERSFNEAHILAISQAICEYRQSKGIDGPLFIGADTHALSQPASENALEVLAANGVQTMISTGGEITPTPAIGDIDGDGKLDVAIGTRDGWLYAWHTNGSANGVVEWESYHHDNRNTGNYDEPLDVGGTENKPSTPLVASMCEPPMPPPPNKYGVSGGCNCEIEGSSEGQGSAALLALGLGGAFVSRRRRSARSR